MFWSSNENREKLWCLQTLYPTTHLTPCFSATSFSQCLLMPKGCKVQNLRPTEASRKLFPVTVRPGAGWSKREILVSLFLSLKQQQQQQLKKNPKNSCQKTRTSEKKKKPKWNEHNVWGIIFKIIMHLFFQEGLSWTLINGREPNQELFYGQTGNRCITEAVVTSALWVDRHGFFILVSPTDSFFNKVIILLLKMPFL